jgi:hypothetical protein
MKSKIQEDTSRWTTSKKFNSSKWVVTEKIHGANFGIIVELKDRQEKYIDSTGESSSASSASSASSSSSSSSSSPDCSSAVNNNKNSAQYKISFAKRKSILGVHEDFFDHHRLIKRLDLDNKAIQIFKLLLAANNTSKKSKIPLSGIKIYGELFGGQFPHPNVKIKSGVAAVQTGIYCTSFATISFC